MDLSIIIPVHNEQDNITDLIEKIEHSIDISHELVIVNDHSIDRTVELVNTMSKRYHNIKLVENVFERGLANTLKVGFNSATAEVVIPVMADLCDDPDTINRMYEKAQEGFDIVCGSRYMKDGKKIGGPRIKTFFSHFVNISLHRLIGIPTRDISNSFKLYRKKVIENINIESKGFEISVEIPLKAYFLGYEITEIPTIWTDRKQGKSKFSIFKHGWRYVSLYLWAIWKKIFRH